MRGNAGFQPVGGIVYENESWAQCDRENADPNTTDTTDDGAVVASAAPLVGAGRLSQSAATGKNANYPAQVESHPSTCVCEGTRARDAAIDSEPGAVPIHADR